MHGVIGGPMTSANAIFVYGLVVGYVVGGVMGFFIAAFFAARARRFDENVCRHGFEREFCPICTD